MLEYFKSGGKMELRHFVKFYGVEGTDAQKRTMEVKSNELYAICIPKEAYALKTFDKPSADIYKDGKKIISKEDKINEKMYYIGKVLSVEEVKDTYGEKSLEYKNISKKSFIGAVKTRGCHLLPISKNERLNIIAPEDVGIVLHDNYINDQIM